MELYLLEYLVAFRDCGTVEAAAAKLNVTAPTVSRGLKKLESQLGVALLERTPAKMTLNPTGFFAAKQAEVLLADANEFTSSVRTFENDHRALRAASTVPGVLELLENYPHPTSIHSTYVNEDEATALLNNQKIDLAITTAEHDGELESVFLGRDSLVVRLTDINELHGRATLTFADLVGHEFVLPRAIGAWRRVLEQNARDAMLMYQDSDAAFRELVRYSNFPIFRTRLTQTGSDDGFRTRKTIPLVDEAATLELYATYRASEHTRLTDAIRFLSDGVEKTLQEAK